MTVTFDAALLPSLLSVATTRAEGRAYLRLWQLYNALSHLAATQRAIERRDQDSIEFYFEAAEWWARQGGAL